MAELLSVQQIAAAWRCHPATVRRRIASGELRASKLGRLVRVNRAEVDRYVRDRQLVPGGVK
jgi:excisionase family DNA binding protein